MDNRIKVLMVEPGKHPKVTMPKENLDSLQKAVSIGADYAPTGCRRGNFTKAAMQGLSKLGWCKILC